MRKINIDGKMHYIYTELAEFSFYMPEVCLENVALSAFPSTTAQRHK